MKVILNESKLVTLILNEMLNEYEISDGNAFHNPYKKKLDRGKKLLKDFIESNGKIMTNIENGRDYFTYEVFSLSETLGVRYCLCRQIKDGKAEGSIEIKPLASFKIKNY